MKKLLVKVATIVLIVSVLPTFSFAENANHQMLKNVQYIGAVEKDKELYISLRVLFKELDAPILWDPRTQTVKVYYKETIIEYKANSVNAIVNNVERKMKNAPFLLKGTLYIPLKDTADFISSTITEVEIDNLKMKYFWGYTLDHLITLGNIEKEDVSKVVLPYGKYTLEDAWKIVDRYEGNYVRENVVTEFKGMEGDYYLFHTYFIPDYNTTYEKFFPNMTELTNNNYERFLWNRFRVHKETGELKVDY